MEKCEKNEVREILEYGAHCENAKFMQHVGHLGNIPHYWLIFSGSLTKVVVTFQLQLMQHG